jgi:hypothetical protein
MHTRGAAERVASSCVLYDVCNITNTPGKDIRHPLLTVSQGKQCMHSLTHRLLFCMQIVSGIDIEWANLVDIAGCHGFNLLTAVQPGSM